MQFSIESALRFGWDTFKRRPWFFIGACVVIVIAYAVLGALIEAVNRAIAGASHQPTVVGGLIELVGGTLIGMGVTAFYLRAHDSPDTVTLGELWHPGPFWTYLVAMFLVGLAVGIGTLLLIIPGIILALMLMFTPFVVIDRAIGPINSLKESRRITHGHKWSLLGFVIVITLINVLGLICLVVGLLVTMPVTTLALTHAYRVLGGAASVRAPDAVLAA